MRRLGKFFAARELVESSTSVEVFSKLGFVPYRVEFLFHKNAFEMLGISPKFDMLEEGFTAPEYKIDVEEGQEKEIIVLVTKVSTL